MRALQFAIYIIEQARAIIARSNAAAPTRQSKESLKKERSQVMDSSIQAKIQRIEASTGMSTKNLVGSILKENNIKLRKELSSHE